MQDKLRVVIYSLSERVEGGSKGNKTKGDEEDNSETRINFQQKCRE
jgi:hypothetical protein